MATVRDPVCGMMIDKNSAAAQSKYEGETYYFCSTACRDAFLKDPGKYTEAGGQTYTRSMGIPAPHYGFVGGGGEAEMEADPSTRKPRPDK
jgi:Cu+-exporting ATPase